MNETLAKMAFERALATHKPDFGTFFLARLLDLEIAYPDEKCIIRFPVRDFLFNPQGSLHGGVIAIVLDISMGHLLHRSVGVGGATLEMKLQYLRPLKGDVAWCQAQFLRRGRSIAFLESRLYDADNQLAAVATSTWKAGSSPAPQSSALLF